MFVYINSIQQYLLGFWSVPKGWSYLLWWDLPAVQVRGGCMLARLSALLACSGQVVYEQTADAPRCVQRLGLQNGYGSSLVSIHLFFSAACCWTHAAVDLERCWKDDWKRKSCFRSCLSKIKASVSVFFFFISKAKYLGLPAFLTRTNDSSKCDVVMSINFSPRAPLRLKSAAWCVQDDALR